MAKKREIIDSAVSQIIRHVDDKKRGQDDRRPRKPNAVGVALEQEQIDQLDEIAGELGVNRHQLMQLAMRQFIADWQKGRRPKTAQRVITTLEPD